MQSHYISIFKLEGISKLPSERECLIASFSQPNMTFTLTSDMDAYSEHIDRKTALSNVSINAVFGKPTGLTLEARVQKEVEKVQSARKQLGGTGIFLVCKGTGVIESPNLSECRDRGDYIFCLDVFEPNSIRDAFTSVIHSFVAALSVCLSNVGSRRITPIGDVGFLVDRDSNKPIYSSTLRVSATAVVAAPLDLEKLVPLESYARQFSDDKALSTVARLLNQSLTSTADQLRSFMNSWAALEIFVNSVFSSRYQMVWRSMLLVGVPASAHQAVDHALEVMKGKFRLRDKFLIIAGILSGETAEGDCSTFTRIKKVRDEFFHAVRVDESLLPDNEVRSLAFRYLALHLEYDSAARNMR